LSGPVSSQHARIDPPPSSVRGPDLSAATSTVRDGSSIASRTMVRSTRWPPRKSASVVHVESAGSPRYAAWTSATSASTSATSATRICRAPPLDRSKPSGIDGSELEHPELAVGDLGVVAPVREPLEQQVP